jgi:Beige/BEACH domain
VILTNIISLLVQISNFEYLMELNTLAGRSYNDITQVPMLIIFIRIGLSSTYVGLFTNLNINPAFVVSCFPMDNSRL